MKTKSKNNSVSYFDMQFITSSISTTLVLLLLGLVVFFVLTAHNLSVYVKENINFSIIISDDMKETDILKLQKRLDKEVFVRSTEYISKKQALREQIEAMGTDPQDFLGYNPLHASIEVKLHSDYANTDSIAKIEKQIKKNTNVQEVRYQEDLINRSTYESGYAGSDRHRGQCRRSDRSGRTIRQCQCAAYAYRSIQARYDVD